MFDGEGRARFFVVQLLPLLNNCCGRHSAGDGACLQGMKFVDVVGGQVDGLLNDQLKTIFMPGTTKHTHHKS
uniref:Secreted protein n=1 Tax=Romanomermis culicivorax TaxID=13658 RepID=A0A915KH51_ROMCU